MQTMANKRTCSCFVLFAQPSNKWKYIETQEEERHNISNESARGRGKAKCVHSQWVSNFDYLCTNAPETALYGSHLVTQCGDIISRKHLRWWRCSWHIFGAASLCSDIFRVINTTMSPRHCPPQLDADKKYNWKKKEEEAVCLISWESMPIGALDWEFESLCPCAHTAVQLWSVKEWKMERKEKGDVRKLMLWSDAAAAVEKVSAEDNFFFGYLVSATDAAQTAQTFCWYWRWCQDYEI